MTRRSDDQYWTRFYSTRQAPILPSQFAAFVANELVAGQFGDIGGILDLGCGNGRDSFFFLQLRQPVIAVDASPTAIASCEEELAKKNQAERAFGRFLTGHADETGVWEQIGTTLESRALIYARFFFHAIDEQAQERVLDQVKALLERRGGVLCVEARTHHDKQAYKETPDHYRRFIVPDEFVQALEGHGLKIDYRVEGLGLAKFRQEDAHVFRVLASA